MKYQVVKKGKQNIKTNKIVKKDKQNKILVYNQQHTFAKMKGVCAFKELSLGWFYVLKTECLKQLNLQPKEKENLKAKSLDHVGDLFNELFYVYQDKYYKEKKWFKYKSKTEI